MGFWLWRSRFPSLKIWSVSSGFLIFRHGAPSLLTTSWRFPSTQARLASRESSLFSRGSMLARSLSERLALHFAQTALDNSRELRSRAFSWHPSRELLHVSLRFSSRADFCFASSRELLYVARVLSSPLPCASYFARTESLADSLLNPL